MNSAEKRLTMDSAGVYRIRIQGHLDNSWSDYINKIISWEQSQEDEAPQTELRCEFLDQAALIGALNLFYDIGMPLLSVEHIK